MIASYPVEKEDDCQLKCFRHRLCVSYNLGPVVENDVRDGEISKSDEFRDPQNMTDWPGYFYRGTQVLLVSLVPPRPVEMIFQRVLKFVDTFNFTFLTDFREGLEKLPVLY